MNRYRRALSGDTVFALFDPRDPDADMPLIPGVERVFRIGESDVELDDLAPEEDATEVTPAEAKEWTSAYRLFEANMIRLEVQAEEEERAYRSTMEEIDRRRLLAWAEYEPVHNKIQHKLT